jgi:uncharacterized protein YacL
MNTQYTLLFIILIASVLNLYFTIKPLEKLANLKNNNKKSNILVDTSGLMDGRIEDIINAGFLPNSNLIIPMVVLDELQNLADNKDNFKRTRARQALSLVQNLKEKNQIILFSNKQKFTTNIVDAYLIEVAEKYNFSIYTLDYNLEQNSKARGIQTINPSILAEISRPQALPGEVLEVKIHSKGESKGQLVGFLNDGTMVICKSNSNDIGKKINVKIDKVIQSSAGRMIFASKINN